MYLFYAFSVYKDISGIFICPFHTGLPRILGWDDWKKCFQEDFLPELPSYGSEGKVEHGRGVLFSQELGHGIVALSLCLSHECHNSPSCYSHSGTELFLNKKASLLSCVRMLMTSPMAVSVHHSPLLGQLCYPSCQSVVY